MLNRGELCAFSYDKYADKITVNKKQTFNNLKIYCIKLGSKIHFDSFLHKIFDSILFDRI